MSINIHVDVHTCTIHVHLPKTSMLFQYMSVHRVRLASERKMRALSNYMVEDNLVVEEVPLSQPLS